MISEGIYEVLRVHSSPSALPWLENWWWDYYMRTLEARRVSTYQCSPFIEPLGLTSWQKQQQLSRLALRGAVLLWGHNSRHYRMRSLRVGSMYRGQPTACLTPCQKSCLSHFKILWEAGLNSLSHREHFEVSKQSSDMTTEQVFGVVIENLNCTGVRCNSVKSLAWWGPGICQGMLYQKMHLVVRNISRFPWIWPGPCMAFNICRLRHPVVFPCTACLTLQGRGLPFRQTRETPFGSFSLATWKDEVDSKSAPKAGTAPIIWWMIFLPHSGPLLALESFALLLPLQGEV